jgi:hypothetical protein
MGQSHDGAGAVDGVVEGLVHAVGDLALQLGEHVGPGVHGDGDAGVAKSLHHPRGWTFLREQQVRARMAEVMQSYSADVGAVA